MPPKGQPWYAVPNRTWLACGRFRGPISASEPASS